MNTIDWVQAILALSLCFNSWLNMIWEWNSRLTEFGKYIYWTITGLVMGVVVGISIVIPNKEHLSWIYIVGICYFIWFLVYMGPRGLEKYLENLFGSLKKKLIK